MKLTLIRKTEDLETDTVKLEFGFILGHGNSIVMTIVLELPETKRYAIGNQYLIEIKQP